MQDFWSRVEYLLEKKHASWMWLATASEQPYNSIHTRRKRNTLPDVGVAQKIAQALGVTIDYLVTGRMLATEDDPDMVALCNALRTANRDNLMRAQGVLIAMGLLPVDVAKEERAASG